MTDLSSVGSKIFVTMLVVNVFLSVFASYQLSPTISDFGGDSNNTPDSVLANSPSISDEALSYETSSTDIIDVVTQFVGVAFNTLKNVLGAALFGFTDFAQLYLPPIIRQPVIIIFGTFMAFYSVIFTANLFNLVFRGQGGSL